MTETARGAPTGYECTMVRTVDAQGNWVDVTGTAAHSSITLAVQTETEVRFENTYARATGSLTITKRLPADADEALPTKLAAADNSVAVGRIGCARTRWAACWSACGGAAA